MFRSLKKSFLKRRRRYQPIEPDEILIDAQNLPAFDTARLEGKIERPITAKTFRTFAAVLSCLGLLLFIQLIDLEIVRYPVLAARAEANTLAETPVIAERGLITDRSGMPLAENGTGNDVASTTRIYPLGAAAANLVGYVSYPKKDANGNWYQNSTEGVVGVESADNDRLAGQNGLQIAETDAEGKSVSGAIVKDPVGGADVHLSIDAGLQKELYAEIANRAETSGWQGGTGAVMDVKTGELLAVVSYPSFDPSVMSSGEPAATVQSYLSDPRSPFLDRAVSGLYTPGSVVKPFIAAAALQENVISPDKQILSTGSISIPNPYDPSHPSVFNDWRANGWVDVRHAIAVSSDVYFYEVGGGFENQPGLGIANIEKYMRAFGFGAQTGISLPGEEAGVIPDPEWKANNFDGERWFLGDTYHTAIGQYGVKVTLMQLLRGVGALANGGTLITPVIEAGAEGASTNVPVSSANLEIAREGMRLCVTEGICSAVSLPSLHAAAKTGTAQVGAHNEYTNSLIEGFFPYENPRYAFVVVMEHANAGTLQGAPAVMSGVLQWIATNKPEMAKQD